MAYTTISGKRKGLLVGLEVGAGQINEALKSRSQARPCFFSDSLFCEICFSGVVNADSLDREVDSVLAVCAAVAGAARIGARSGAERIFAESE